MKRLIFVMTLITAAMCIGFGEAGSDATAGVAEVTRAPGGSIRTMLSQSIVLNEGSTLVREWIAFKHSALPVKLNGTPGIKTKYDSGRGYSGSFKYTASFEIDVAEPVTAIEIRFLTFDVWGETGRSLVMTRIKDFAPGTHTLDGVWNLYSENEASEFYASIAYVSRIRTKDGKVLVADVRPVVDEAQKFNGKFTETDLEPEKPGKE